MQNRAFMAVCLLLGLSVGIVGWIPIGNTHSGPHLAVQDEIDMGVLNHDEYRSIALKLHNDGHSLLELQTPVTGCACTTGKLSKTTLKSGEMAEVSIRYHAAQYPGTTIRQIVILHSNCNERPKREVVLRGRMRGALLAVPAGITVGRVCPHEAWQRSIVVRHSDTNAAWAIRNVGTNNDQWTASVEPNGEHERLIRISSTGEPTVGLHRGRVLIETDLASQPILELPIAVEVRSAIRAVPSPVVLRLNGEASAEETITFYGPAEMRLTRKPVTDSIIDCVLLSDIVGDESPSRFKWRVKVAGRLTETARGSIEFRVEGVPHETTFSVPFMAVP